MEIDDIGDPHAELALFSGCRTLPDVRAVLWEQVGAEVAAILELVVDADAFDVIELMRLREFPPVPDPRVAMPGGSALAVELIAAVLLSRPNRQPSEIPREQTRPHEVIDELHTRAKRLGRLAIYRQQAEARLSSHPFAKLSADYQGAVLNIRNLQYEHIRDEHERELFTHPVVDTVMRKHLGYCYADVLGVRNALHRIGSGRMTRLRDETAATIDQYYGFEAGDIPEEALTAFRESMIEFIMLPGVRATITVEDIAELGHVDSGTVEKILTSYSQEFDDTISASARVYDLLFGKNPFLITPLVADGAGGFVSTVNEPGLDSLRRVLEQALKSTPDMTRYDQRARKPVSEKLAIGSIEKLLPDAEMYADYHYYAPKKGKQAEDVGPTCTALNKVADLVEGDGLFIIDDVVIVVEVKAKSIAAPARRGDVNRLERELKATIGEGDSQAVRIKRLLEANEGIWLANGVWRDLSHVREVRSIVVLLDDVGPLGVSIGQLQAAGVLAQKNPSWVASLHDLAVIADICDHPGEFLLYLQRRTESDVAKLYHAVDELDLFMLFLEGRLYVEDDPDEVRQLRTTAPPARTRDRRARARTARPTRLGDQCQPLNEWYQRHEIPEFEPRPAKPSFNVDPAVSAIIDEITSLRKRGWLRFAADLLSLAGKAHAQLLGSVKICIGMTLRGGEYHDMMLSSASLSGHPAFFIGVSPDPGVTIQDSVRLARYAEVKSYQLQSDRSYAVLIDTSGSPVDFHYFTRPPVSDPELDRLVGELGLQPVGADARPRWAPRPSNQSKGRRKSKKRKRR